MSFKYVIVKTKVKRWIFPEKSKMFHLSETVNSKLDCDVVLLKEINGRETK